MQTCERAGSTPILCSPTPYDEYTEPQESIGLDQALMQCASIVENLAKEKNLIFVNMRDALMSRIAEKPIGPDHVHPNSYGHHLLAECFLCSIGAKSKMEPEKEVLLHDKNKERYRTEQILRRIVFVERNYLDWQNLEEDLSLEERKAQVRKRMETEKSEYFRMLLQEYWELVDFKEKLRGEVVKKTVEMYKD